MITTYVDDRNHLVTSAIDSILSDMKTQLGDSKTNSNQRPSSHHPCSYWIHQLVHRLQQALKITKQLTATETLEYLRCIH